MIIFSIVIGLLLIVLGFLVKRYPDLIAGYNSLSPEAKARVDIDGLSTMMRNQFFIMGMLMIILHKVLAFFNMESFLFVGLLLIVFIGTCIILMKGKSYE